MVDKELIENWRNMVKLLISSLLFKTNYEGMGEQDKEEFERDFDEILDLALIGLKHKAQLSQEGTTKGTTSDLISRQQAIDALDCINGVEEVLRSLPPAQPEPQWIPIAEHLLKDGTWNIFTDGKNISVERYKADAIDHFFPNGRWFDLEDVIAWMPLPEPYRKGATP